MFAGRGEAVFPEVGYDLIVESCCCERRLLAVKKQLVKSNQVLIERLAPFSARDLRYSFTAVRKVEASSMSAKLSPTLEVLGEILHKILFLYIVKR